MFESNLIDVDEVAAMLGNISTGSVWRGVKSGRFPKAIKLGPFISRWDRAEIQAYIDGLKAKRA